MNEDIEKAVAGQITGADVSVTVDGNRALITVVLHRRVHSRRAPACRHHQSYDAGGSRKLLISRFS
jgi:hypothetical protein